ncbi:hypothetical protein H5410_024479 [Solanum commersonii]|uniref:Uncharacterized protein n=1 Tax=Solanum commersonii TaxID=4109 RepID=A0A9J5ZM49_SOLCO|nr:hypothetical protein H5410_024479 [Solanum commersonii]
MYEYYSTCGRFNGIRLFGQNPIYSSQRALEEGFVRGFLQHLTLANQQRKNQQRIKGVHTHFAKLKQWITLLPVIGHLHLFSGSNLPHKTFGLLAVKYGPIFTVKFGAHQVLVVNDRKIAQDCFTTNDKALASRLKRWQ